MDAFIARQPILDRRQDVYGYELLFRSGLENVFNHPDPTQASSKVIADTLFVENLEALTVGKKSFINMTREVLLREFVTFLPAESTCVEILETVEPDPEVVAACKRLRKLGYLVVLDDYTDDSPHGRLLEVADIVKVDFLATEPRQRRAMVQRLAPRGIRLVAEKLETRESFDEALELGFDYFQGYFFSKPVIARRKEVPEFKLHYLQILSEIYRPEVDLLKIENIIKQELSLGYKLLRLVNAASFGWKAEIRSIKQALTLLGEREIKKWTSLIALATMAQDKPEELVVQTVMRARFWESLAPRVGLPGRDHELFLMGMFSRIDAILDRPLPEILTELPLSEDLSGALLGEENRLRQVYECGEAYEQADWHCFSARAARLGLKEVDVPTLYFDAAEWTHRSFFAAGAVA